MSAVVINRWICLQMFADNIRICSESRNKVEQSMERWKYAPERRGITVSGRRP